MSIAIIIPTYGHFEYAERALRSAYQKTRDEASIIFVDDASPDWDSPPPANVKGSMDGLWQAYGEIPEGRKKFFHFAKNAGLTSAWNFGLHVARDMGCTYTCVTNSDVIFSQDWDKPILANLEGSKRKRWDLLGPVTNGPGSEQDQHVRGHHPPPGYVQSDAEHEIDYTSRMLQWHNEDHVSRHAINGFCMVAKTETWWQYAYTKDAVFKPKNEFNSKMQRNPTPGMTLQEYELQARWREAGLRIGYCPGSFVFHYRSVTRGDRYKGANWYRTKA